MSSNESFKATLNLPRTPFAMKADLPLREPEWLERWQSEDLYNAIRRSRAGRSKFVLHDGPPYANGEVHLGTALNKILKDVVVRVKTLEGYDAPYLPGWDCHGMPIEHAVTRKLADFRSLPILEVRRQCREFAAANVATMRESFKRLGVLGRWEQPYLTMDFDYEAEIVAAFRDLVAGGYIFKGLRPLHWCASCRTALAEAEVEYDDHASPSIYVKFDVPGGLGRWVEPAAGLPGAVVIWTTTPWTLPANLAIAFHPEAAYVAVEVAGSAYLVAAELLAAVAAKLGWSQPRQLGTVRGRDLEGGRARHPWIDRDAVFVLADYVTLDAGTGAVHTAPGHGAEDFETGRRYQLPPLNPVDEAGIYTAEAGEFQGQHVFKANPLVVEKLRSVGALLAAETLSHSFPHCWRCKSPLIYRATEQWFFSVEHQGLRARLLDEVAKVRWVPTWGEDRIRNMVATRPDWCLSRQRAWGVPLPVFDCTGCGAPLLDLGAIDKVVAATRAAGSDVWYREPASAFVPAGTACASCGGREFVQEKNILDVWFDASCSQRAVLEKEPELSWPASLYLEGADQHRGWFQASLLTATATRGHAPYEQVLTHGLILDEDMHKISKSKGNAISPDAVIKRFGADILRLYCASVDYTADFPFGWKGFDGLAETYRKVRNTCRFGLGNLYDFDPVKDAMATAELKSIDRYALLCLRRFLERSREAYDAYEFHRFYHLLVNYTTVDLSAFYFDLLKDRLYTQHPRGPGRRSAQTVIHAVVSGLAQVMSPILCFTADEVWRAMPHADSSSVHLSELALPALPADAARLEADWGQALAAREESGKHLEALRTAKTIGSSVEARLVLKARGEMLASLKRLEAELAEAFIVSEIEVQEAAGEGAALAVEAGRALGVKCARCWKCTRDVGSDAARPNLCGPCAGVVRELEG